LRESVIADSIEAGVSPDLVNNVGGWLEISNTLRNQVTRHRRTVDLNGLNAGLAENLVERLVNSNEDVTPYDLLYSYEIVWPNFVGAKCRPPSWWPKKLKNDKNWARLWNTPEDINCLAYSLIHLMYARNKNLFDVKRKGVEKAARVAKELMEEMSWGVEVDIDDALEQFVGVYKDYEIVVLTQASFKTGPYLIATGENYVVERDPEGERLFGKKLLYLYMHVGIRQKHVVPIVRVIKTMCAHFKSHAYKWCYDCHYAYDSQNKVHVHDGPDDKKEKKVQEKLCPKCNEDYIVGDHKGCPFASCIWCKGVYTKLDHGGEYHRCILYRGERKESADDWNMVRDPDGSVQASLCYDIETTLVEKEITSGRTNIIKEFNMANGKYVTGDNGFVGSVTTSYSAHRSNFISCKDRFTGERWDFFPRLDLAHDNQLDDVMERFINFACYGYNKGNNQFIAHHGKGYDTVLLSHYLYKHMKDKAIEMIRTGRKIMQMVVGLKQSKYKTTFVDSMCHLPGSLANLAKAFCPGVLEKGYFPHKFNRPENYGYEGEVPAKEFFDPGFSAKNQKDMDVFDAWLATRVELGPWKFMEEMPKYLHNDVDVLVQVTNIYGESCKAAFGIDPWKSLTGATYVHQISIRNNTKNLFDKYPHWDTMQKENPKGFVLEVTEAAKNETWAVLKPTEYAMVSQALRGGRTECFKMYADLTKEEYDAGVRYRHVDITSSYPAQQIRQQYPVGLPKIYIYDAKFAPCWNDNCRRSITRIKCDCILPYRRPAPQKILLEYVERYVQPTAEQILEEEWGGYFCVTLQPCKMPVMVLGIMHPEKKKNVYTAELIKEVCLPSNILLTCLKWGYKLVRVHAFHEYKMAASLFRELVMQLFIKKTVNAGDRPEEFDDLIEMYRHHFDDEFADEIQFSGEWTLNPALKQVYKILLNSGWGKHAQRPRLTKTKIFDEANEENHKQLNNLHKNCVNGKKTVSGIENYGQGVRAFSYEDSDLIEPDLHDTYLAAAAFVPAYGQLQLWNEMNNIEMGGDGSRRIVYCDTDSIIYKWYPEEFGFYNVPEKKALLGGWTLEAENIVEVVALQPKTYCYKFDDGSFSAVKTKGVRMGYRLLDVLNFEKMKEKVVRQMKLIGEGEGKKVGAIVVPQEGFANSGTEIYTEKFVKKLRLDVDDMKGVMLENGDLEPFGWNEAPEQEVVMSGWKGYKF